MCHKDLSSMWVASMIFLFSALTPRTAVSHPLRLSVSLIEYDASAKAFSMQCKVFMDDFQKSLILSVLNGRDLSEVKKEDRPRLIEAYFQKFYSIKHNGKAMAWAVKSVEYLQQENILWIKFQNVRATFKAGDTLDIANTMFFVDFGEKQTNRIVARIPAFNIDVVHAAKTDNYTFSHVLGDRVK